MKKKTHSAETIAGLALFCIFTVCMLFVLMSGAGAYKDISAAMEEQHQERTVLNYITAKIRHFDSAGGVSLTDFEGSNALALEENIDGDIYETLIYYYDGYIYELFSLKDSGLTPADGFEIIPASGMVLEQVTSDLLYLECSVGGRNAETYVYINSDNAGDLP